MADNRENTLLEAIADGESVDDARTVDEVFLKAIAEGTEKPEEIRNRLQYWLSRIESGGGVELEFTEPVQCIPGQDISEIIETANDVVESGGVIFLLFNTLGIVYVLRIARTVSNQENLKDLVFDTQSVIATGTVSPVYIRYDVTTMRITLVGGINVLRSTMVLGYIKSIE